MRVPKDFPRQCAASGNGQERPVENVAVLGTCTHECCVGVIAERFAICEDLATQVVVRCISRRHMEFNGRSEEGVLAEMRDWLDSRGTLSGAECSWVIRRAAMYLHWDIEESIARFL